MWLIKWESVFWGWCVLIVWMWNDNTVHSKICNFWDLCMRLRWMILMGKIFSCHFLSCLFSFSNDPSSTAKIYLCDVSTESGMFSVSFLLSYFLSVALAHERLTSIVRFATYLILLNVCVKLWVHVGQTWKLLWTVLWCHGCKSHGKRSLIVWQMICFIYSTIRSYHHKKCIF